MNDERHSPRRIFATAELAELARTHAPGEIELIVEVALPESKVTLDSRGLARQIQSVGDAQRGAALDELERFLRRFDGDPVVLKSARAISVSVPIEQLEVIAASPLVKRISLNRRLKRS